MQNTVGRIFASMPAVFSACPTIMVLFGEPQHGWLPVTIQSGDFQLAFDASYVPVNPLESLCEALAVVPAGGNATVVWNLEPAVYRFSFDSQANEVILEISEASNHNQLGTCVLRLTGSIQEVFLPFHSALAKFTSYNFDEKHWPLLAKSKVKQLGQRLRSQR